MNRLVLAFGIVCLLQGLSAEPKPEFGLANNIPASSKITTVKGDVNSISNSIKALVIPTLTSGMTKLDTTKTKITTIINDFDTKTKAITAGYDTLLAATDGNVDGAFSSLNSAIEAALTYISGDGAAIGTAIADLTYTGISDELNDAFTRIAAGLTDLKTKSGTAQTAIKAAYTADNSANVSSATLRQYVTLKIMYDVLNSATKLRTYLPLVKYILTITLENLSEADTYVNGLKAALNTDVSTISGSFTAEIKSYTDAIKTEVAADFASGETAVGNVQSSVNSMTGIMGAPKANDLKGQISTLKGYFGTSSLGTGTTAMASAFTHIETALAALITSLKNAVTVTDNPLVNKLIDTLMGNDEYGRYCYNKYKDLVKGLFDVSFDAGWMCVDRETARLQHLKMTLVLIIDQLAFDYEDIGAQIDVCNNLGFISDSNTNACVDKLNTFYANMIAATKSKIDLVFTIASDEAVAVENRLLICFNLVNLDTSITQVATITEGLNICSNSGPNGTD
ncbi:uncharacterized protein LOC128715365 [Anopheles marshallii]|uniref:uncharacterized protein LOC128715365 n=1 Tax=Anopheles marshallii TaxID=1521116 RepID=UPI00237AEC1A|nr:uncharacterized protein LOC128715365 [Anopheles marshallii]